MNSPLAYRILLALASVAALLLVVSACGGDDDGEVTVDRLACDRLMGLDSYHYESRASFTVAETDPPVAVPPANEPVPFSLAWEVQGDVIDGGASAEAQITTDDSGSRYTTTVIETDGKVWHEIDPAIGFIEKQAGSNIVPYLPGDTCAALRNFVDLSVLVGSPEKVNGVSSFKYDLVDLDPEFLSAHQNYGGSSDAVRLPEAYNGAVWVASDGGYATKVEVHGSGSYASGRVLTVELSYELSDINDVDVEIDPPSTLG